MVENNTNPEMDRFGKVDSGVDDPLDSYKNPFYSYIFSCLLLSHPIDLCVVPPGYSLSWSFWKSFTPMQKLKRSILNEQIMHGEKGQIQF